MEDQFAVPGEFKPVSFPLVMNQQLRVASHEFFGVDFRYRWLADRLGLWRLGLFFGHEEPNRVFSPDTLRSEEAENRDEWLASRNDLAIVLHDTEI